MTKKIFARLALITVVVMILLAGVAILVVAKMCYRPVVSQYKIKKRKKQSAKLSKKYGAKTISLLTDDGILLSTVLLERKNAKRCIVLCHGYLGSKEKMCSFVKIFPHDTIVLFDFRAHGASGGDFISFGYHEKNDIKTVVNFLRTHEPTRNISIIGLGCSMGGATLLAAAASGITFDALIIDSSFADLYEQVEYVFTRRTGLPKIPFMFFTPTWFNYLGSSDLETITPAQYARAVTCPTLVIHSSQDTFTPVKHGHKIYQNLGGVKHMWLIADAKHAASAHQYSQEYKKKVHEFLELNGV